MKRYYKEENGKTVWFNKSVKLNGFQIFNPTEEQILSAGYVEYVEPIPVEPTEEELLAAAKKNKIEQIKAYDESKAVNNCVIKYGEQSFNYWADKSERDALKGAIRDCITMGRTHYRLDLREIGLSIWVECEKLLAMMVALEVYAIDCFNKTTDHIFAVNAMATVEEVKAYKFKGVGYPEQLTFSF